MNKYYPLSGEYAALMTAILIVRQDFNRRLPEPRKRRIEFGKGWRAGFYRKTRVTA